MNIYLAGPVVGIPSAWKEKMRTIRSALWIAEYDIYAPSEYKVENEWALTLEEWSAVVFNHDVEQIRDCDAMIVCDFGRKGTCGTAWEVGYAYGIKIPIYQIMCADEGQDYSLMIHKCANNFMTYDEFMRCINDGRLKEDFFILRGKAQQNSIKLN